MIYRTINAPKLSNKGVVMILSLLKASSTNKQQMQINCIAIYRHQFIKLENLRQEGAAPSTAEANGFTVRRVC